EAAMILILTEDFDPHAEHVAAKLRARGVNVVRFNPAGFPAHAAASVAYLPNGLSTAILTTDGAVIDLNALTGIWYRRPQPPLPDEDVADPLTRTYLAEECKTVLNDVWHALDCAIVPAAPAVLRRAEFKAAQLSVAGRLGFE